MEVLAMGVLSFILGILAAYFIFKELNRPEPVGFLYVKDSELFLELAEPVEQCITGKTYVTMEVRPLDSSQE